MRRSTRASAVRIAHPRLVNAPAVLATVGFLKTDRIARAGAAAVNPPTVRSLDAVHLATALELVTDREALVAYDKRLGEAAESAGPTWAAPLMIVVL